MKNSFNGLLTLLTNSGYFTIKKYLKFISILVLVAFLNLITGCKGYYKVKTYDEPTNQLIERINKLNFQDKIFILHSGGQMFWLKRIRINEDKAHIQALVDKVPANLYGYFSQVPDKLNPYKNKDSEVVKIVNIYSLEYAELERSNILIPIESIRKIDIYDQSTGATLASFVFTTAVVVAGALGILYIIYLLTKSSCPFIYSFDGESYTFSGEIFSGATQPGLERHDYLLLKQLRPFEDKYLLRVTNEIREIQHINFLELLVIDHPENTQVLLDKYGQPQTFTNPSSPIMAKNPDGTDILHLISHKDSLSYHGDGETDHNPPLSALDLTFEKPEDAKNAKLIIRAKNSFWLEHVFKSFHDMFGRKYNTFDRAVEKLPLEKQSEWIMDQNLPLAVYLHKDGTWLKQDYFEIAGPMALKDDILPINLEGVEGNKVNIRLESGFLFWEIDYVAMDFSSDVPVKITPVSVETAMDEQGKDVSSKIAANDNLYYIQPEVGNEATLTFPVPEFLDESRTVILHSKGFYKVIRENKGKPDRKTLKTFRQPGRLPQYSKELYEQMMQVSEK